VSFVIKTRRSRGLTTGMGGSTGPHPRVLPGLSSNTTTSVGAGGTKRLRELLLGLPSVGHAVFYGK